MQATAVQVLLSDRFRDEGWDQVRKSRGKRVAKIVVILVEDDAHASNGTKLGTPVRDRLETESFATLSVV